MIRIEPSLPRDAYVSVERPSSVPADRSRRQDAEDSVMRGGDAGGEPPWNFAGDFFFSGIRNDRREYARRPALAA